LPPRTWGSESNPSRLLSSIRELDPDLLNVNCSKIHVTKALLNLIINACESIKGAPGTVTISTMNRYLDEPLKGYEQVRRGEYTVVLSVSDDGPGIDLEDLDRIFEPFYTKKKMGRSGSGLGLAVVWNTLQDHQGYKDVKSDEKGTVFELYFPAERTAISNPMKSVPLEEYLGKEEKILVVDDEERQRDIAFGSSPNSTITPPPLQAVKQPSNISKGNPLI
jgi:two-component system cell cycle sensor histidine kinase/response regulator CckA